MTVSSRRTVLQHAALGALAVGGSTLLPPLAEAAGGSGDRSAPRGLGWNRAAFASRVGQSFRFTGTSGAVRGRLVAVHDLSSSHVTNDARAFSAVFKARRPLPGGQGLFRIHTESGHTLVAFVVPVDRGASAKYYQLIVNRRTPDHAANTTRSHR